MFSHLTAATVHELADWAIGLVGLGLLAAWYLMPRFRPWRTAPPRAPAWDAPVSNTILLVWGLVVAGLFIAPLCFRGLVGPATDLVANGRTLAGLVCLQAFPLLALQAFARFARARGQPFPPPSAAGTEATDSILLGAAVFALALPLVLLMLLLSTEVLQRLGIPVVPQDLVGLFVNAGSPFLLLGFTFVGVVLAPLNEELLFRAGLFRILGRWTPKWVAVLLSAAIFAGLHLNQASFLPLLVLGALLALAYEKTGSLLVPVTAHALFNLNSIVGIISGKSDLL